MAWDGYFMFNGTEVINATRTEAYAEHHGAGWFRAAYSNPDLPWLLGESDYTSPLQDEAPWTDPDRLDSYDFWGAYPLEITGIEDSTVEGTVVESIVDGGYVGKPRKKTRTVVFSAVLVGASECAVEYGMRWLRNALTSGPCFSPSYGVCGGADLCFLSCEPCVQDDCGSDSTGEQVGLTIDMIDGQTITVSGYGIDNTPDQVVLPPAEACYAKIGRSLHDVTTITGPAVTQKMSMKNGGEAWSVTWTMVAANPAEFGVEQPIVVGFLDPAVEVPYYKGVIPAGAIYDSNGHVDTDDPCPITLYTPVFDPMCDLLQTPPDVPTIVPQCFAFPANFMRYSFSLPAEFIPLWDQVVPIIKLSTKAEEARNVRLRFYADVFGTNSPDTDPCNYCGDIVISYLPPSSTLVIDAADQQIYVDTAGIGRRRADSLATDSSGRPMDWPEFSCGFGYVVTVDMPQQQTAKPVVDMALVSRII